MNVGLSSFLIDSAVELSESYQNNEPHSSALGAHRLQVTPSDVLRLLLQPGVLRCFSVPPSLNYREGVICVVKALMNTNNEPYAEAALSVLRSAGFANSLIGIETLLACRQFESAIYQVRRNGSDEAFNQVRHSVPIFISIQFV